MPLPLVNAETGHIEQIPEAKALTLLQSGNYELQRGQRVPVQQGRTVKTIPAEQLETALGAGWQIAPGEEVARARVESRGLGDVAKTGAEALVAGGMEAALAPARVASLVSGGEGLPEVSGRKFVRNIVGLAGADEEAYEREARERAEDLPVTSTVAGLTGQLVGGLGTSRIIGKVADKLVKKGASTTAVRTGQGAAEGVVFGGATEAEGAWLENQELTADRIRAGMGLGGLLGIGLGAGLGRLERGRAARQARVFGAKSDDVAETARPRVPDADVEEAFRQSLPEAGIAPGTGGKLREGIETAQAVAGGVDVATLRKYGALRWDDEAVEGGQLWLRRDEILEGASKTMRGDLDDLMAARREITDEVVNRPLKREHVAKNLAGIDEDQALAVARRQARSMREQMESLAETPGQYGSRAGLSARADWARKVEVQVTRAQDPADAYMALDQARRELYREASAVQRSIARKTSAEGIRKAETLAPVLQRQYETLANNLWDEAIWGGQGRVQADVNRAWVEFIGAHDSSMGNLVSRAGREYPTERPIFRADPTKIHSYLDNMGRPKTELLDQDFRGQLTSTKRLTEAIAKGYDLPADKVKALAKVRATTERLESTLARADKTVRVANQINEVVQAGRSGGALGGALGGGLAGGVVGGPVGFALGAALGVVSNPGKLIAQRAALVAMSRHVDARVVRGIKGFFEQAKAIPKKGALKMPGPSLGGDLPRAGRRAALGGATALAFTRKGEDKKDAYTRNVKDLSELAEPEAFADRLGTRMGDLAGHNPGQFRALVVSSARSLAYLQSQLPEVHQDPELQRIGVTAPSDAEIDAFQATWEGVMDPASLADDLERGFVHPAKVDAVKATAPAFFEDLRVKTLTYMAGLPVPPPLEVRAQADLMLDLEGSIEPTLRMEFQQRWGNLAQAEMEAEPPARRASPEIAKNFMTRSEAATGAP